jgi:hypothetical protein
MSSNLDRFETDLEQLITTGAKILMDFELEGKTPEEVAELEKHEKIRELRGAFRKNYQRWYTESLEVIRQIIPSRLQEFEELYRADRRRKNVDNITYCIEDWLKGIRSGERLGGEKAFNDYGVINMKIGTQFDILKSAEARFASVLFDIRQMVQADLFDCELDAARELNTHGFTRGAGAIAGVVLEKHLAQVADNHRLTTRKKHPGISAWYDLLKKNNVIDVPTWRKLQHLGDLRNLCDHNKELEPTKEQAEELIQGVTDISKTVF